jgi:hypothetical protein
MFDKQRHYNRLTEAGLPAKQARVMTDMLVDIDNIINPKDKEQEDGDYAIQCDKLLKQTERRGRTE